MNEQPAQILCPKCGSNQITADKKGFSGGKALMGDLLVGPVGLLAGTIGSGKVNITCLNCGNEWKPGETQKPKPVTKAQVTAIRVILIILLIPTALSAVVFIVMCFTDFTVGTFLATLFFAGMSAFFWFLVRKA